ncbi:MAG: hypothetical protein INQ03_04650 [Candidatus Heimdallarchaeota archaeon]|nr:hypothetical protein [Candidatus Heimdallarchaeota archaeon]
MTDNAYPRGECPYCGRDQNLLYKNAEPKDNISNISKLEDPIITDSFHEIVIKVTCKYCNKQFHFMVDLRER